MPEIDLCGNKSVVQLRDVYHAECIRKVLAAAQAQHEANTYVHVAVDKGASQGSC